jgi:Malectin domain
LPGERKTLTVEAAATDLGGEAPLLAVDGWNVTVNPAPASNSRGISVVPNIEAQIPRPTAAMPANAAGAILGINCGGSQIGFFRFGAPPPAFAQDRDYQGGKTASMPDTGKAIDTQVPNAAPAAVYQSERWGRCTYTIPVTKGRPCTVRLHFAEAKLEPGQRKFNVDINGRRVLNDYDIAAEAGKDKAVVKDFPSISPDTNGNIVVAFTRGTAGEPKICGIQILR